MNSILFHCNAKLIYKHARSLINNSVSRRHNQPRFLCSAPSHTPPTSVLSYAKQILTSPDPMIKVELSLKAFNFIKACEPEKMTMQEQIEAIGIRTDPPDHPARPNQPLLVQPRDMPSYKSLGVPMADYLLHGLAHIELNAIDTAWDTVLRFADGPENLPLAFYRDFAAIASDEARHFKLLCERLQSRGTYYGAMPAHNGIWDGAEKTKHDLKGRLTVIQLVQEPRALDSWERLVEKFKSQSDKQSSNLIDLICREEIDHVQKGVFWFQWLCEKENLNPIDTFHEKAKLYVGVVPAPFNTEARLQAGMSEAWYIPISKKPENPRVRIKQL